MMMMVVMIDEECESIFLGPGSFCKVQKVLKEDKGIRPEEAVRTRKGTRLDVTVVSKEGRLNACTALNRRAVTQHRERGEDGTNQ